MLSLQNAPGVQSCLFAGGGPCFFCCPGYGRSSRSSSRRSPRGCSNRTRNDKIYRRAEYYPTETQGNSTSIPSSISLTPDSRQAVKLGQCVEALAQLINSPRDIPDSSEGSGSGISCAQKGSSREEGAGHEVEGAGEWVPSENGGLKRMREHHRKISGEEGDSPEESAPPTVAQGQAMDPVYDSPPTNSAAESADIPSHLASNPTLPGPSTTLESHSHNIARTTIQSMKVVRRHVSMERLMRSGPSQSQQQETSKQTSKSPNVVFNTVRPDLSDTTQLPLSDTERAESGEKISKSLSSTGPEVGSRPLAVTSSSRVNPITHFEEQVKRDVKGKGREDVPASDELGAPPKRDGNPLKAAKSGQSESSKTDTKKGKSGAAGQKSSKTRR